MSKTKKRQAFAEQYVFSAEEFEASGIRELSFEELLKVNGGKVVKDDPWTDKNSETCPYSSNAPRTDSSSGSSGGGSSSSNYGSSSGTNNDSSGYSEPVTGNHSDDSGGYTDYPEAGYIDYPGNGYTAGYESGGSSGGGSGSTGGSSGNSDSSDDSSSYNSSDSSDNDYSSGDDSDSGYWGGGYTPPAQSQPAPKPNKGEETSPTQGGGAPYGEAVATVRNQGKNTGAINSGTKSRGASSVREFWGNVLKDTTGKIWDKFGNVNKTNAESYIEKSRGGSWQSKENFPVPTAQGSKPSSGGYVPPVRQEKENIFRPSTKAIRKEADKYTHHSYIKGQNEFRCDNYVEAVIRDSGLNPLDFLAGAATEKNVEQHIVNAREKGFGIKSERYKPQNLEDGVYIVLMNNSDKNFNAHAGMIFQEGGRTEYRDNSSCNTWVDKAGVKFEGGVIKQDYSDLRVFQADYGYNDFYYIRIN